MSVARHELRIVAPALLTRRARARDNVFTAIMWGFYIYLWIPLISLFAWLMGFEFAYDIMIRAGGVDQLADAVWLYFSILLVIMFLVAVWSLHNKLSYGHLNRRKAAVPVTNEAMADYFEIEAQEAQKLRSADAASIDFDEEGRPVVLNAFANPDEPSARPNARTRGPRRRKRSPESATTKAC